MLTKEDILNALRKVSDPELGRDIVSLNMVPEVEIDGGNVSFTLNLTTPACPLRGRIEESAKKAVTALEGVKEVHMKITADVAATRSYNDAEILKGVKNIIAVASGKGGVGKSTVAVNLAVALASSGAKVGILDADIYGPSIPLMMGVKGSPVAQGEVIVPPLSHGVKIISLGFFFKDETPLIWRGPMVANAIRQLLTMVNWGNLDYLIVDLPPGTGDASLTLAQTVPLSGVVIVTTPQDAAASIASKALAMFRRLNVPILGVIENMSYLVCPHCNEKIYVFSTGGGRKIASLLGVQFLGEIPLNASVREQSDRGVPVTVALPNSIEAVDFKEIAFRVAGMVSIIAYTERK